MDLTSDQRQILGRLYSALAATPPNVDQIFRMTTGTNGEYVISHPGLKIPYSPNWFSIRQLIKSGLLINVAAGEGLELSEQGAQIGESEFLNIQLSGENPHQLENRQEGSNLVVGTEYEFEAFVAYAHEDSAFIEQFRRHLTTLQRSRTINFWYDGRIVPGQEWDPSIKERLSTSDIFFPIVSSDFIASEYSWEQELNQALQRRQRGELVIVPIIARPCDWKETPLGSIQALPAEARPIATWASRDDAWVSVVRGIRTTLEDFRQNRGPLRSGDEGDVDDDGDVEPEDDSGGLPSDPQEWGILEANVRLEEVVESIQQQMDVSSTSIEDLTALMNSMATRMNQPNRKASHQRADVLRLSSEFKRVASVLINSSAQIESDFGDFSRVLEIVLKDADLETADDRQEAQSAAAAAEDFVLQIRAFTEQIDGARSVLKDSIPDVSRDLSRSVDDLDYALLEFSNSGRKGAYVAEGLLKEIERKLRSQE